MIDIRTPIFQSINFRTIDVQADDLESAQQRVDDVLAVSLREALHEPGIQAMELGGDIAHRQGDAGRAIDAYEETLRYIDETGFVVTKDRVTVKLAASMDGRIAARGGESKWISSADSRRRVQPVSDHAVAWRRG